MRLQQLEIMQNFPSFPSWLVENCNVIVLGYIKNFKGFSINHTAKRPPPPKYFLSERFPTTISLKINELWNSKTFLVDNIF